MNSVQSTESVDAAMMSSKRIVVTGLGVWSPCGKNVAEFAEVLRKGETGIREHHGLIPGKSIWAGLVENYDPTEYFTIDELERFDRTAQMGYMASRQAVEDAGLNCDECPDRIALTLGTSHGGRSQLDDFVMSGSDASKNEFPRKLLVTAAHYQQTAAVASKLRVHGPTATLSNACSSSGAAIAYGVELLISGKCDYAIAGGADGFSRLTFSGFSALGAMSDGACAPFSEPVGLSLGDGAAFVVLETLEQAQRRGAKIYAELWGYGLSWDAYHITAPEPSGEGMNRAIRMAVERSGINRHRIDYVNVHGTGTRSNDLAETVGLQRFFDGSPPPVSATKSQTGHMLGASSSVGLISCILGMKNGWLPPTSNFTVPRAGCELDVVPNKSRPQDWSCFMAQSAAFAGANAVLIGGLVANDRQPATIADDEIVITGVGIVSPLGCGYDAFASAIHDEHCGIAPITEFDVSECGCKVAGMVRDFQPRKLMPTISLRRVDRVAAYATIAASLALQHGKRWPLQNRADTTGLVVGICRGAATSYEKYLASVVGCKWEKASAVYFPNLVMSSVGGQVSASLGLKGITSSLVGGTAAGLQALIHGWELFRRNPAQESVVVLAADELAPFYYSLFDRAGRLAPDQEGQSTGFRPYCADSSGMVLGEGAAAFVLERAGKVRERGGKILATLRGSGLTSDAAPYGEAEPTGKWLGHAASTALKEAKFEPHEIDAVYGSGQGRPSYDSREREAIQSVFGMRVDCRSINHLTGVAEATSSLFQVAAALAGYGVGNASDIEPRTRRRVAVSASGDDGANAFVVMETGE